MAKADLNPALTLIKGSISGLVLKNTPHGQVLSRCPDMSRVQWSPAQIAHRKLMKDAASHYRQMMADPKTAERCIARAKKLKLPVSSLVMGEFVKAARARGATPR